MPALPTTPIPTGIATFTISFIDAGGEETTTSITDFTKLVLVFENDSLDIKQVTVPAPDLTCFLKDRVTVDIDNTDVLAAINAILNVINAGTPANTYKFVRGYRSDRMRKLPKSKFTPLVLEPGAGDLPPEEPGLVPVP